MIHNHQPARASMSDYGPVFGNFIGEWHRWFAWKPIRTYDQRFVWLRNVWRRSVYKHQHLKSGVDFWWWHQIETPTERENNV